ncbi:MAG TPA: DUF4872 domain-containing protein [Gemmatimonadales bacterium]|jgi:hypothetical protein|nr:DUF4872 domain-containing protein [Gemmatimonadales bacterium]
MTSHKHLKQLVRARMAKTGESYSTARRQVLRQAAQAAESKAAPYHFPGNIPAAAALRSLLAQAGARNPRSKAPFSEAMVFGIAGGIGAGMFAFHYAKENFSSFYLAGRHLWQDHLAWARGALERLGIKEVVKESSGVKPAEKQLRELLAGGRPVLAWVDGYRIVAIHSIDDTAGTALVGDLADEPVPLPLPELAATRGRIKSYKNRLLALEPAGKTPELAGLARDGIQACVEGLSKGRMKNFTLEIFASWADRLDGSKAADAWEKIFPPGPHLYSGLRSIHEHIEHSGTGGGLCRPLFAEFLEETATALGDSGLGILAERYAKLGAQWSALADAALPDSVPEFRETKALLLRKSESAHREAVSGRAVVESCAKVLSEFSARMKGEFPLDAAQCTALRKDLKARVTELVAGEREAVRELGGWLGDR